jgi:hypothetical protein
MPQKVVTTDETLHVYQMRHLSSTVVAQLSTGIEIELGDATVYEGREWMEASVGGTVGYVLGPAARSHTTLGAILSTRSLSPVDEAIRAIVAEEHAPPCEVLVSSGSASRRYCRETVKETLDELASDVQAGGIPKSALVVAKTKEPGPKGKLVEWHGTLESYAERHAQLGVLYWPVRHYSRLGLSFGIIIGCGLWLVLDGIIVFHLNRSFGFMFFAVPALCAAISVAPAGFRNVLGLASFVPTVNLALRGLYPMVFGAIIAGGLMLSFPGMALGGIVGALRRLPKA